MQAGRNVRGFDFHLPQRFADGCVHKLTLRRQDGEPLPATGTFVAFPDGLAQTRLRRLAITVPNACVARLYDQLMPASLPLADYVQWRERFPSPSPASTDLETAVIVAGNSGPNKPWQPWRTKPPGWTAAVIDGPAFMVEPDLVAEFLAETAPKADILVVLMAGAHLDPDALARIASAFDDHPDAHALYGDLDFLANDGQLWPIAFPAFDYERMLEQGYCAHLFAMRREIAVEALQSAPNNLISLL